MDKKLLKYWAKVVQCIVMLVMQCMQTDVTDSRVYLLTRLCFCSVFQCHSVDCASGLRVFQCHSVDCASELRQFVLMSTFSATFIGICCRCKLCQMSDVQNDSIVHNCTINYVIK